MANHKKHIDYKRVMWTILIPIIAVASTYGVWLLGNCWFIGKWINSFTFDNSFLLVYFKWLLKWGAGLITICSPIIIGYIIYGLIKLVVWAWGIVVGIFNFYYHNGEE